MPLARTLLCALLITSGLVAAPPDDTLPDLPAGDAPDSFAEMWAGFDPRAEPLGIEVLKEWEEDGVTLRVVRFRIGRFKLAESRLAAIYGFPTAAARDGKQVPGLLQIHGGGQYADHKACLTNAKRGYATLSIAWAGRISAPGYRVSPSKVQLFWDGKTDDPRYRVTTDWGLVDGYHAPGRNPGNVFPSAKPHPWTIDDVESPRNSGWFLCALAARRGLTFLERQPEVDPNRLGVYGHSMGGKLTVMTSVDERVKACAPSCGGISDRDNDSALFRKTIGDDVSLREINCPIMFLSPSNDFHGRIGDLPAAVDEINTDAWRVTCSPHHNHQDTPEYEVATQLWFDQHLKGTFRTPATPRTELQLETDDGVPTLTVTPDASKPIVTVDVYYTQQGKADERPEDRLDTMTRFWHHVKPTQSDGAWTARLPISSTEEPLWVYANVRYSLDEPITGAGYYYGIYTAEEFVLSSLLTMIEPNELRAASVNATLQPTPMIEDFTGDWQQDWFTYRASPWSMSTHKIGADVYRAPDDASLMFQVRAAEPNTLVVLLGNHAAEVNITGGNAWQSVTLSPNDFKNYEGEGLQDFAGLRTLKLSAAEHLRSSRRGSKVRRIVGKHWQGEPPQFRDLRWITPNSE